MLLISLSGCSRWQQADADTTALADNGYQAPPNFHQPLPAAETADALPQNLQALLQEAEQANHQLAQQRQLLQQAQAALKIQNSDEWPQLELLLQSSRSQRADDAVQREHSLALSASWELDIWGRLNAASQAAVAEYWQQQSEYEWQRQSLLADVITQLLSASEADALLQQRRQQLQIAEYSQSIAEQAYRLGTGTAVDLHLANSEVSTARALLVQQQSAYYQAVQALQILLGRYPDGQWQQLPDFSSDMLPWQPSVPAAVVAQRADVRAAYYRLLASDYQLAVAHRDRFPQFTLKLQGGVKHDELSQWLKGDDLFWSFIGGITQPLFNHGRLQQLEAQALSAKQQQELAYLQQVYNAFEQVEMHAEALIALAQQQLQYRQAEQQAELAETRAREEYRKGLETFTTLLDAQGRAVSARISRIGSEAEQQRNRVALLLALGQFNNGWINHD